jgi:hypothetical protein
MEATVKFLFSCKFHLIRASQVLIRPMPNAEAGKKKTSREEALRYCIKKEEL